MDANGCGFHIEAIFGDVGIANSGQVWSNNGELIRELRNERPPHSRGLRIAVEKDHGRPVASCEVVNLDPIDLGEPGFDRVWTGLGLAHSWNCRHKKKAEENRNFYFQIRP